MRELGDIWFRAPSGSRLWRSGFSSKDTHRLRGGLITFAALRLPADVRPSHEVPAPVYSPCVIRLRFRMDQHFEQLRRFLLEAYLQRRRNIMHARERQVVCHGAVA
jgi:hypothetical protein